jgi:DNA-binding GntR family transcriptional regulator
MSATRNPSRQTGLTLLQTRIVQDIVSLVRRENLKAGDHIAEATLAKKIGTSRTPVNIALRYLAETGVLSHDLHRGHFLNRNADELGELVTELLAVPDDPLYLQIAEDRLAGNLPDTVNEIDLMRRYEAQRSKVRKILLRIQQEEWIDKSAGHGWIFLPMIDTNQAYEESYLYRAAIEPEGLLSTQFHADSNELATLRQRQQFIAERGYQSITPIELFEAGCQFHETLAKWSNNRFILQGVRRTDHLRRLVEYRHFTRDREFRHDQAAEHVAILDAIVEEKLKKAADLLRKHLEGARQDKVFKRNVFTSRN